MQLNSGVRQLQRVIMANKRWLLWVLLCLASPSELAAQVTTGGFALGLETFISGPYSSDPDPGLAFLATLGMRTPGGLSLAGGFRYWRSTGGGQRLYLGALLLHVQQTFTRGRLRPFVGGRIGPGLFGVESFVDPEWVTDFGIEIGLELGMREVGAQLRLGAGRQTIHSEDSGTLSVAVAFTRRGPPGY